MATTSMDGLDTVQFRRDFAVGRGFEFRGTKMQLDDVAVDVDAPDHPIGSARPAQAANIDWRYRVAAAPLDGADITANAASRTAAPFRVEP
jgi:hypothetical protein